MSVVLICFPGAPKVSPEAVKREAELDKYLEARVEGKEEKFLFFMWYQKLDVETVIHFHFVYDHCNLVQIPFIPFLSFR